MGETRLSLFNDPYPLHMKVSVCVSSRHLFALWLLGQNDHGVLKMLGEEAREPILQFEQKTKHLFGPLVVGEKFFLSGGGKRAPGKDLQVRDVTKAIPPA